MDFGKKMLEKYGWKDGEGLGKDNNGINKPIRANLKFDTIGFGHDRAVEFTDKWWERVYNNAANNLQVEKNDENITLNVTETAKIEDKKRSLQDESVYKNFQKSSFLTNQNKDTEMSDEDEIKDYKFSVPEPLSDEQLIIACGGRTAHKGARHGLSLSGKLSRIEEQDRKFLERSSNNSQRSPGWKKLESKKKSKRKAQSSSVAPVAEIPYFENEYVQKSKKKSKEAKRTAKKMSAYLSNLVITPEIVKEITSQKKPKKKRNKLEKISTSSRFQILAEIEYPLQREHSEIKDKIVKNMTEESEENNDSKKLYYRNKPKELEDDNSDHGLENGKLSPKSIKKNEIQSNNSNSSSLKIIKASKIKQQKQKKLSKKLKQKTNNFKKKLQKLEKNLIAISLSES